jgi:hypothetical protein
VLRCFLGNRIFLGLSLALLSYQASYCSNLFPPNFVSSTKLWNRPNELCSTILIQPTEPLISRGGSRRFPSRVGVVENLQMKYSQAKIDLIEGAGESNIYRLRFPNGPTLAAKVPNAINEHAHHAYRNEYDRFFNLTSVERERFIPIVEFDPGGPFLIMRHVQGTDLGSYLSNYGPDADPLFILETLREIALSIKVLHDKGIVHGDLKPSNVMVDQRGKRLLVGDLSFATETDEVLSYVPPGTVAGTKQYLPKKERHGYDRMRVHRDLYALKIATQALVLGEEPFLIPRHHLTRESAPIGDIRVLRASPYSILDGVSPVLSAISIIEASSIDEYLWLIDRAIDAFVLNDLDKFFLEAFAQVLGKRSAREVAELIWMAYELRLRLRKFFFWPQKLGLFPAFYREVMVQYRKIKEGR